MTELQLLRLQHSIETVGEMIIATILLGIGVLANGFWSVSAFIFFAFIFAEAVQQHSERRKKIASLDHPAKTESSASENQEPK